MVKKILANDASFGTNNINQNNLVYTLLDLSFTNDFNLWNIESSLNIVYDKTNINLLNYLQNKIFTINFKLIYMISIIKASYPEYSDYDFSIPIINSTTSLQYYTNFYNGFNTIVDNYVSNIESSVINILYETIFFNTKILVDKYNEIIDIYLHLLYQ